MKAPEFNHDEEMQAFRLERPEMFAYRVVAYLSRFGSQACWPVELVELAKIAQRRAMKISA